MDNLITILLIGLFIYALYIVLKIYKLKRESKQLKDEYVEKGGMTEEQKIAKEEELENQRIQDLIKTLQACSNNNDRIDIIKSIPDNDLDDFFLKLKNVDIKLYYNIKSVLFFPQLKVNASLSIILIILCFLVGTYLNGRQANTISLVFIQVLWLGTALICGKTIWVLISYLIYKLKQ